MTREQIVQELQKEYADRRENNLRAHEKRVAEACARCPGLKERLNERQSMLMQGVRASLLSDSKGGGANQTLPARMKKANEDIAALLEKGGLPRDFLQPVYTCAICRDEGYVYDPSRRVCDCFQKELCSRVLRGYGTAAARETFESFDPELFSAEKDERGISQRAVALLMRDKCEAFANEFPDFTTATPELLLIGQSGLGKTYLLNAIVSRVASRGHVPQLVSAYRLLDCARKAYFAHDDAMMQPYYDAPLLLVDDLGTEPLIDNVTVTQLFNLLNERRNAGLSTVISTNLTLRELKDRYTERIASRWNDSRQCTRLNFIGADIRARLRRED